MRAGIPYVYNSSFRPKQWRVCEACDVTWVDEPACWSCGQPGAERPVQWLQGCASSTESEPPL